MNIKTVKRTIINSYLAAYHGHSPRRSYMLKGKHGLGKSQVIFQVAAQLSILLKRPFEVIDIRLGQYEIGDLTGLQRVRNTFDIVKKVFVNGVLTTVTEVAKDVCVHDLPLWFPRDPDWRGFIFFDELNRGSVDTQQWAMQAVLDYRANFVDFPAHAMVLAAGNPNKVGYHVRSMDIALDDRLGEIEFAPSNPEWLVHAHEIGVWHAITKYIEKFGSTDLDPPEVMDPDKRYPSRRSWVSLSEQVLGFAAAGDDPRTDLDYLHHLVRSWVGDSIAVNFVDFFKKDYKVYTAKEILTDFPKLKSEFEAMVATDIGFYNKEIADYIAKGSLKLTEKQRKNLTDYFFTIPKETAVGFWRQFLDGSRKEATAWYNADPRIVAFIKEAYTVVPSTTKE
jgi:hypothetical protein